jgi:hypothetical protein
MNAKFRPPAHAGLLDVATHADPVDQGSSPGDRACCCVARAMVRVVMPPAEGRPHDTELLLCGHHYRVSRAVLSAAHARVEELPASQVALDTWFDDHGPSARVTTVAITQERRVEP